ncbi:MAG: TraR/DksA family transcriptional regulator [Planctomycetota bacterium]|nr:TraR/DksA family transcriptional regulator [Planctomycetota bacterium]
MARNESLLRLHERLIAKRDSLRFKLSDEFKLSELSRSGVGDVGDAANDGEQNEVDTQLASLESRELHQIEQAIHMIRTGRYGMCESCDEMIPIERLKALPFTPMCVECQRVQEEFGSTVDDFEGDWENAFEFEGRMSEKELTLGDLDLEN